MSLSGSLWDVFIVFGAGVLVSFTPCVYPVMPLTVSCISRANLRGTRSRGFFLSLIFVLGLSLTYCVLAVIAALAGKAFGLIQNQPVIYAFVSALLFFFGLVMLDVFSLPWFGSEIRRNIQPQNVWTVFILGVVSGFVIGPCTAPVLGTLLLYIGSRQNIFYGVALMFFFSYGVGFSLILIGTFSGLLSALPKSGAWMNWVKRLCGAVIFTAAAFFLLKALRLL